MQNPLPRLLAAFALLIVPMTARAQHDHDHDQAHAMPERFGTVHFPISSKAAQADFTAGLAMLHSFAYPEAAQAFEAAAAKDPKCGIAYWGVAMTYFHVIWGPPTKEEFAAGRAASRKATAIGATTARERDYIAAIGAYYEADSLVHATRVVAFEKAMAALAAKYADDHEASIFYALAMLGVAYNSPPDKTYARQKHAAEILNGLLASEPDHPGIAHYMIHSFDYPQLAELALPAARAYAKIAPSAPHALHMPSHIFTRLGMWHESIESNLASAEAARRWIQKTKPGATAYEGLHAMDYLAYAYLQSGQDDKARELVEAVGRVSAFDKPAFQAGFALAAIPARYALERRAWKEAAALAPRPASYPWADYPYDEAIVHFARAVGGARSGDLATARDALAKLTAIRQGLQGKKGFDWATQVEIQRRAAAAWLAHAEGNNDEALAQMRSAAELEDSTDKHPVTPGSVLPAREQLGDLLVELARPKDAIPEYESSLRSAPARFNSYAGLANAAERAGDQDQARTYRDKLTALCGGAVPDRSETKTAAE